MQSGMLTHKDGSGDTITPNQYRQTFSLTIEKIRRSLRNRVHGSKTSDAYLAAQKEMDIITSHYIQTAAAAARGQKWTGDRWGDIMRRPTKWAVDGGVKSMRIKDSRKGYILTYVDARGRESENSIYVAQIIKDLWDGDAAEFYAYVERNGITDMQGEPWKPKRSK